MDLGEPITAFARSGFGEYSCPRGSQHKPHLVYRSSQDKGKIIRILHCSKNHPLKIMVMQARILEKQEAVQERKARKKVLFSVLSCTSFNISHAKQANYLVSVLWFRQGYQRYKRLYKRQRLCKRWRSRWSSPSSPANTSPPSPSVFSYQLFFRKIYPFPKSLCRRWRSRWSSPSSHYHLLFGLVYYSS